MTIVSVICLLAVCLIAVGFGIYTAYIRRSLTATVSELQRQQVAERDKAAEMNRLEMEMQRKVLLQSVENLSQKLAVTQADRIKDESKREINNIVEPLRRHLDNFDRLLRESGERETAARASLKGQIESLINLNRSLGDEARDLANALRSNGKAQGDWGEMQLTSILQQAGLEQGVHYRAQVTRDETGRVIRSEEGGQLRPDVLLNLPDNRTLVIDSKVSLTAYINYNTAADREQRKQAAKRHLDSVKKHIAELGTKDYPKSITGALDQSLMFIPIEGALQLALSQDPGLLQYAASMKVAIVTPVHLYSIVLLAEQLWRQDTQKKHVLEIAEAGGKIYDKLAIFVDSFNKIGENLRTVQNQYETAVKQLSSGKGNLISRVEKLKTLGANAKRQLPDAPEE